MTYLFLLIFSILQPVNAMCEFPHNPPVLCVEGHIIKSQKLLKHSHKCKLKVKVKKMIRPSNVYYFTKELNKVEIKKVTKLKKKVIDIYSNKSCKAKEIRSILEYNCSDKYSDISDLAFLDKSMLKGKVFDPWQESSQNVDCGTLLSK